MSKGYTQKEIKSSLESSVAFVLKPSSVEPWPELTLQCLREYMQAMMGVPLEHVKDGMIKPEELVAILACAALYVHLKYVMKRTGVPEGGAKTVIDLLEKKPSA